MCDHKIKEIGEIDYKTGLAPVRCKECKEYLGKKPATYQSVIDYCNNLKIRTHFRTSPDWQSIPEDIFAGRKMNEQM